MAEHLIYIAVCGPGEATAEEMAWGEAVGRALAEAGAVTLTGGLGGVMDAAAKGATESGGIAIGILPGHTRAGSSRYLSFALPTGLSETRNTVLVRAADAVVAVSGGFGALSEIAFALKIGVPVVGLQTWQLSKHGERVEAFDTAEDAADAVRRALELAEERRRNQPRPRDEAERRAVSAGE